MSIAFGTRQLTTVILVLLLVLTGCAKKRSFETPDGLLAIAFDAIRTNDLKLFQQTLSPGFLEHWGTPKGMALIQKDMNQLSHLSVGEPEKEGLIFLDGANAQGQMEGTTQASYFFRVFSRDKQVGEFQVDCEATSLWIPSRPTKPKTICKLENFVINEPNPSLRNR